MHEQAQRAATEWSKFGVLPDSPPQQRAMREISEMKAESPPAAAADILPPAASHLLGSLTADRSLSLGGMDTFEVWPTRVSTIHLPTAMPKRVSSAFMHALNEAAEQAYFKMDNVVIDDRRIHVDFYQSMYHQWRMYKRTGKPPPAHPAHPHKGHGSPQEEGMVMPRRRQEQQYADRHPRQQSHQSHQGHHLSRGEGGSRELGSEHAPRDRRERRRERSPERERQHRHRHKHRRERSSRRERHGNERRSSEHRSHKRHRSSEDRERYSRQTERRH